MDHMHVYGSPNLPLLLAFLNADITSELIPKEILELRDRKDQEKTANKTLSPEEKLISKYLDEVQGNRYWLYQDEYNSISMADALQTQAELRQIASILAPRVDPKIPDDKWPNIGVISSSLSVIYHSTSAEDALDKHLQNCSIQFGQRKVSKGPGRPPKKVKEEKHVLYFNDLNITEPFIALAHILSRPGNEILRQCQLSPLSEEDLKTKFSRRRLAKKYAAGCNRWFIATRKDEIFCCYDHKVEERRRKENTGPNGPNAKRVRKCVQKKKTSAKGKK